MELGRRGLAGPPCPPAPVGAFGAAAPQRRWEFTDLEFKVLCDDFRRGKLPRPFTFTSRLRHAADFHAEAEHLRRALRARSDPAFDAMIGAISRPEVIVVAHGWEESAPRDPRRCTYLHAVRRGTRGYVITQRPGETVQHSSGFDIVECPASALAETSTELLPPARAGTQPGFTVAAEPDSPATGEDAARSSAFFGTPAASTGYLRVLQSQLNFRLPGTAQTAAVWRDLPGDGRYLVLPDGPRSVVTGMGRSELSGWLNGWITHIVARLESGACLPVPAARTATTDPPGGPERYRHKYS